MEIWYPGKGFLKLTTFSMLIDCIYHMTSVKKKKKVSINRLAMAASLITLCSLVSARLTLLIKTSVCFAT